MENSLSSIGMMGIKKSQNRFINKKYVPNYRDLPHELTFGLQAMTETYVAWSPYGTYLGTFHAQGVILWGGATWEKIVKFAHPGVKLLDFSPQENYLVTVSAQFQQNDDPKDPQVVYNFISLIIMFSGELAFKGRAP